MAIRSDAQKKAVAKYNAKSYEQILVRVKIGESEKIKAHAATQGETLNGFIKRSIAETIQRDQAQSTNASAQQEPVPEGQPTKPQSFLENIRADVEQIVSETDKAAEEKDWESWKKHNTF